MYRCIDQPEAIDLRSVMYGHRHLNEIQNRFLLNSGQKALMQVDRTVHRLLEMNNTPAAPMACRMNICGGILTGRDWFWPVDSYNIILLFEEVYL